MQFDIKLKSQDMYRFNMYQTYTGFHGWFSIIVSIIIFIVAGLTYGGLDITYTVLYIAFGIIFLLYMPVTLWLRSKSALAASEVLRGTLHYLVDENRKSALIGSLTGAAFMGIFSIVSNYFLVYPVYYNFMPEEVILAAYQAILPSVKNILQCLICFNMPFTIVKGMFSVVITFLTYKHISPILKGSQNR